MRLALGIVTLLAAAAAGGWWYVHRLAFPVEDARNSVPAGVVGCWALFDDGEQPAEGRLYWSPSIVRLRDEPNASTSYDGSGTVRRAERLDSIGNPMDTDITRQGLDPRRFTYWAADSLADRLRVRFSTGLSGTQFVFPLPASGSATDTLAGQAFSHWDFYPYYTDEGSAYAIRVSCTS